MNDMKRVGRVALKALIYFEAITILAPDLRPGRGGSVAAGRRHEHRPASASMPAPMRELRRDRAQQQSVSGYLLHIIPTTLVSAFTEGEVLQVLFVSVLFGFALASVGERGRPVLAVIEGLSAAFFRIVGLHHVGRADRRVRRPSPSPSASSAPARCCRSAR